MEEVLTQLAGLQILNQFWFSLFLLIPMILIARTVVAGTRYSPILMVVIFGLIMGYTLVSSGVSKPGLPEFTIIAEISRATIIALTVTFFVGGQELRKIFGKIESKPDDMVVYSREEIVLGTNRTQFIFIIRAFFLLLGIEALSKMILGVGSSELTQHYPLIAYIGMVGSVIFIDYKATIANKPLYIRKGIIEIIAILAVLLISYNITTLISDLVALPQIFFAMLISAALGALFYQWTLGPTIRALLFAGIPVVLAGNFMIGGSRLLEAFSITGMNSVIAYGFFGQMLWMFGGIALLMVFGGTRHVRNLAPGMAGSLSHSGLTGACTAGDLGKQAAGRAPIMINVPFLGHIFVFSILAFSMQRGYLMMMPVLGTLLLGAVFCVLALRNLRRANGSNSREIAGLMQFSFGWQVCAVFGGLTLLNMAGVPLEHAAMGKASALSHFGLFAAVQGGMFGVEAATLIPFIFAMPFLVHPLVFYFFGRAMENNEEMPRIASYGLAAVGTVGVALFLAIIR